MNIFWPIRKHERVLNAHLGDRAHTASFGTLLLIACAALPVTSTAAEAPAIAGRWITFDRDTGMQRALIEIVSDGPGATGRIVELYLQDGEPRDPGCERCEGTDRGRPIRGLSILALEADTDGRGFHGTVLDPEEGTTYHCKVTLLPDGMHLRLRGFIGLEIFGRTETWRRAD